jgi:hypothetical protein
MAERVMAERVPAMTKSQSLLRLNHQIDVEDRQFENIGPAAFFDFQK